MGGLAEALKEHEFFLTTLREKDGIESLVAHSQDIVDRGLSKDNHTVYTISVQDEELNNGRPTVIPSFWNGQVEGPKTSTKNALASGRKWPSASSEAELQKIDEYAHVAIVKQEKSNAQR